MMLSFKSGAERVANSTATTVGDLAQDLAKGLLMGFHPYILRFL